MDNTKVRRLTREAGVSGTLIQSGFISAEEYNRRLSGRQALQTYDIMSRSDADIHSILEVVKLPILAAHWDVHPAKDKDGKVSPADQEIADHISRELFHRNIDFDDLLYQALDMLDFGFSVFEKVLEYDKNTNLWGISKIAFRKQTTIYAWETRQGKPGITQMSSTETYDIPIEKLVVFTNKKRGDNYEGISLLRYAFKDWDMKDKLTLVNGMALEKLAVGVPVIGEELNAEVNETDMDKAEAAMAEFRASHKGYIRRPKGVIVEMMDMKGQTTKDVIPTLQYHKRSIYSSVLATFLDLGGSAGSGSQSLSKDLTSLFLKSEEYIAKTIRAVINNQIIKPLCDFNYSNLENGYPEINYGTIGDDDITALAAALQSLTGGGLVTPDAEMEDVLRGKLGMPAMPDDLKSSYEERRQAALQLQQKTGQQSEDTDEPDKKPAKNNEQKTKKDAAITASQEAQRRVIEVIFADDEG